MCRLLTLLLIACVGYGSARRLNATSLQPREFHWHYSCHRNIPGDPRGRKYFDRALIAFRDAKTLAERVSEDIVAFRHSTAYSHYFLPHEGKQVLQMYDSIISIFARGVIPIPIACGSDVTASCNENVYAFTDVRPGLGAIVLCNAFFNDFDDDASDEVKYDLDSKPAIDRPGQPGSGWCQPDEDVSAFLVAGVTVLHEITHLNKVGVGAGLFPELGETQSHGTHDIGNKGPEDESVYCILHVIDKLWEVARELKYVWEVYERFSHQQPPPYKPPFKPHENAESYAAAALEYYFLVTCDWTEILPRGFEAP